MLWRSSACTRVPQRQCRGLSRSGSRRSSRSLRSFPAPRPRRSSDKSPIPLEVTFAGMPGLKSIHSKSLYGLSDLKMNWNYGNRGRTRRDGRKSSIASGHDFAAVACQRDAADLARVTHGGDLPLCPEESQGQRQARKSIPSTTEGAAGLGNGARVPHCARGSSTSAAAAAPSGATRFSPIPTVCGATASR